MIQSLELEREEAFGLKREEEAGLYEGVRVPHWRERKLGAGKEKAIQARKMYKDQPPLYRFLHITGQFGRVDWREMPSSTTAPAPCIPKGRGDKGSVEEKVPSVHLR